MIAENLLEKIGYTSDMQKEYEKFRSIADKRIIEYTKEYINGECSMVEIQKKIDAPDFPLKNENTIVFPFSSIDNIM